MSEPAIRAEGLSKRYRIGLREEIHNTLAGAMVDFASRPVRNLRRLRHLTSFRNGSEETDDVIWALKDVSLKVQQGEILGVIGPNGAGKSTLLKVLSKITEPTSGRALIRGRISTLLEVGTGFHPELTGRENVFLNGAVLGMTRGEIRRKFDDIVDFSGVGKFIDTPVKRFSTGMQVRLAFSVAAFLEPEILMVDEVLAVGDADFQKRSIAKMEEVGQQGRTVVFVSHNMNAVQRFCTRGVLLRDGIIANDGPIEQVVRQYLGGTSELDPERVWPGIQNAPGNEVVRLTAVRAKNEQGEISSNFDVRDPIDIEFEYVVLEGGHQLCTSIEFGNTTGQCLITGLDNYVSGPWGDQLPHEVGRYKSTCSLPGDLFNEGDLHVNIRLFSPPSEPGFHSHVREMEVLRFRVNDGMSDGGVRGSYPFQWGNVALRPRLQWSNELVSERDGSGEEPGAKLCEVGGPG